MNLKKAIEIGRMDRRVTVLNYTTASDLFGDEIQTWADGSEVWANVRTSFGTEPEQAGKEAVVRKVFFTVRYSTTTTALTEKNRLRCEGKEYEIESIGEHPDTRRRYIVIQAKYLK